MRSGINFCAFLIPSSPLFAKTKSYSLFKISSKKFRISGLSSITITRALFSAEAIDLLLSFSALKTSVARILLFDSLEVFSWVTFVFTLSNSGSNLGISTIKVVFTLGLLVTFRLPLCNSAKRLDNARPMPVPLF